MRPLRKEQIRDHATTTDAALAHPARTERPERPERSAPARADRPARPASRPHGQWKVDGTEPLNANEEWKQVDNGLSVRDRIERVYSKGGFASIDPTDLHGRFRVWGLYTQRKPGIDGGRTRPSSRTSSRTSTSCSACASTAGS